MHLFEFVFATELVERFFPASAGATTKIINGESNEDNGGDGNDNPDARLCTTRQGVGFCLRRGFGRRISRVSSIESEKRLR